jgi:hypothetical protein
MTPRTGGCARSTREQRRERLAAVEDDRQVELAREAEVGEQRAFLLVERCLVAEAVETRLADRRASGSRARDSISSHSSLQARAVVRMQARAPCNARQAAQPARRAARRRVDTDYEQPGHFRCQRTRVFERRIDLAIEAEVAVGVEDLHGAVVSQTVSPRDSSSSCKPLPDAACAFFAE